MRSLLIISLFFIGFNVQCQNTGLYGKKWCIDVIASGRVPLLNIATNSDIYKSKNGVITSGKNVFDYGFRTAVSYAIENNFALGMEFDFEFTKISAPTELILRYPTASTWQSYSSIKHEGLSVMSTVIMPTLSFTAHSGLLPIGLSHQFGIGFLQSKVLEKDYEYLIIPETNEFGEVPITSTFAEDFYNYDKPAFKGIALMYTLTQRTPINKFMMITYGFRYNYYNLSDLISPTSKGTYYFGGYQNVEKRLHRSIISLNLGMSFAL
jgi:hypothetical protein